MKPEKRAELFVVWLEDKELNPKMLATGVELCITAALAEQAAALKEAREAVAEARQWFQETPAHGCPVKLLHKLDAVLAKEYQ